uniref:Uncharacterized protein LOC104226516 n=1 Tax=Nicotiana sylvestris TaxID=4096 RepID=A0A1U7WA07_NICSY
RKDERRSKQSSDGLRGDYEHLPVQWCVTRCSLLNGIRFTLKDDAKYWLQSLPQGSIRTWEEMTKKFLAKYFSSAETGKFRRKIHNFCQNETETVFKAWERFKEIMRKCQHSGIELWMQLQDFWDGLTPTSRRILSNAAGGPLMKCKQWPSEIAERRGSTGVRQVDANTSMHVQLDAMAKEIRKLTLASIHHEPHAVCDICGKGHPTDECQASTEEVNAVSNYKFNAMGQRHSGLRSLERRVRQIATILSERIPGTLPADTEKNPKETVNVVTLRSRQFQPQQPIQSRLEDLMNSFITKTDEILDAHGATIKELGTGLRSLERRVRQIATILSERIPGTLPADTEKNPKETAEKKKGKKGAEKKKKEITSRREESDNVSKHMPALPFPQKLYKEKLDKQFERYLDILRQVNVNLSFTEFSHK